MRIEKPNYLLKVHLISIMLIKHGRSINHCKVYLLAGDAKAAGVGLIIIHAFYIR